MLTSLDMFYSSRDPEAVHISDSDPSNSANTDLTEVPQAAVIRFENGVEQRVEKEHPKAPAGRAYEASQFLINRAMIDPDAVVEPIA
jgi:hypothetical protein